MANQDLPSLQYIWESCITDGRVVFSRLSPDGEEGYPGDVLAQVC